MGIGRSRSPSRGRGDAPGRGFGGGSTGCKCRWGGLGEWCTVRDWSRAGGAEHGNAREWDVMLLAVLLNEEVQRAEVVGGLTGGTELGDQGAGLGDLVVHGLFAGSLRSLLEYLTKCLKGEEESKTRADRAENKQTQKKGWNSPWLNRFSNSHRYPHHPPRTAGHEGCCAHCGGGGGRRRRGGQRRRGGSHDEGMPSSFMSPSGRAGAWRRHTSHRAALVARQQGAGLPSR